MYKSIKAKFMQNDNLKEFLIDTKDGLIVEASKYDNFWGIGMSIEELIKREENKNYIKHFKGSNELGKLLMYLRDEIKNNE